MIKNIILISTLKAAIIQYKKTNKRGTTNRKKKTVFDTSIIPTKMKVFFLPKHQNPNLNSLDKLAIPARNSREKNTSPKNNKKNVCENTRKLQHRTTKIQPKEKQFSNKA